MYVLFQVNDTSLLGKTKEDVVMMLLGIIDEVRLIVRFSDLGKTAALSVILCLKKKIKN